MKYEFETGGVIRPNHGLLTKPCDECGKNMDFGNVTKCGKIICSACRKALEGKE